MGTGYWFRNSHELLLVGTRGNIPAPPPDPRLSSVFHDAVGRHSEKATIFTELIASWFPHQPKLGVCPGNRILLDGNAVT